MRWTRVVGSLALAIALSGCEGGPAADIPRLSQEPPGAPTQSATGEPAEAGPIPRDLRVEISASKAEPSAGGIVIDLAQAVTAPSVDEAPVGAGMLLAQLLLSSNDDAYDTVRAGTPYLMTRAGEWRTFDLARYGFGAPVYGELSMTISSDGRYVAFADPSGLVTVDLRDNTFKRFELPVREAITVEWSSDGSTLLLKDRHSGRRPCGPKGCALDVSTGRLSAVPFDLFYSTYGHDDVVVEVKTGSRKRPGHVIRHQEGLPPSKAPLQYLTSASTAGGPAAAEQVAYAQCLRLRGVRDAGVVVVDPVSGHVLSMLTRTQQRACRLGARTWLTDRHLVVDDWVTGDMWVWDVQRSRVRQVAVGRTSGVNYSIAGEVMADRF